MPSVFSSFENSSAAEGENIWNYGIGTGTFPLPGGPTTNYYGDAKDWFTWSQNGNQMVLSMKNPLSANAPYFIDVTFWVNADVSLTSANNPMYDLRFLLVNESGTTISSTGIGQKPLAVSTGSYFTSSPLFIRKTLEVTPGVSQLKLQYSINGESSNALNVTFSFIVKVIGQNK